jgi:hypothetical protein
MDNNEIEIESQLQTVKQAIEFLSNISVERYQHVLRPHFTGSSGAHMRHILDHYIALKQGLEAKMIDYNYRHRESNVALCPKSAIIAWLEIKAWLVDVSSLDLSMRLKIVCETSLTESKSSTTSSTLGRELLFVSSHAIHHFSLLSVISSLLGDSSHSDFGMAPATASYLRQSA